MDTVTLEAPWAEPPDGWIGEKLKLLYARLAAEKIEVGISEQVLAARMVAELAATYEPGEMPDAWWHFLLRANLTPLLAKSADEAEVVRRVFLEIFPETAAATPVAKPM